MRCCYSEVRDSSLTYLVALQKIIYTYTMLLSSTPLAVSIFNIGRVAPSAVLATLNTLRDSWDLREEDSVSLLHHLLRLPMLEWGSNPPDFETFLFPALSFLRPEIGRYFKPAMVHYWLDYYFVVDFYYDYGNEMRRLLVHFLRSCIDAPNHTHGYTLLHKAVAACCGKAAIDLSINGANLHICGTDVSYTYYLETPTSLAIRSSRAFCTWQSALRTGNIDLPYFVQEEMKTGVMREWGWSSSGLLEGFNTDFIEERDNYRHEYFRVCEKDHLSICVVQVDWLERLEEIRLRHTQAPNASSRTSAANSVANLYNPTLPMDRSQSQTVDDSKLADKATKDLVDICSSPGTHPAVLKHPAVSKMRGNNNSQCEGTFEGYLRDRRLLCWHLWHELYESSHQSQDEESDQVESDEEDSPFLLSI